MRRPELLLGAAFCVVALAPLAARVLRSWPHRIAVSGHSMEPTLRHGDWLLVDPRPRRQRLARRGDVIVARDPRAPERLLVKRVVDVLDGRMRVAGDHPSHAIQADAIGLVPAELYVGTAWWRYWPPKRVGPVDRVPTGT